MSKWYVSTNVGSKQETSHLHEAKNAEEDWNENAFVAFIKQVTSTKLKVVLSRMEKWKKTIQMILASGV